MKITNECGTESNVMLVVVMILFTNKKGTKSSYIYDLPCYSFLFICFPLVSGFNLLRMEVNCIQTVSALY